MPKRIGILPATIVGLFALAIAMGVGRFAFTPMLPLMQDDHKLTVATGGILASVHFLGYWLGAIFASSISWSPRKVLGLSLLTISLATLGMGLTDSFALWLLFRWLCGACSAFTLVLISDYTIKHLAKAGYANLQGWVFGGVGAGITVIGLGTLVLMSAGASSSQSWLLIGLLSFAATIAVWYLMGCEFPNGRHSIKNKIAPATSMGWAPIIAYGAAGIGYVIPATYLPIMARETVQSTLIFGWTWPLFGIAAFASTLISTQLHARFSNRQIWITSQLVMAFGILLPVLNSGITAVIVAGICVGGTFMIITMAGIKEAHRIASQQNVQRHIAALTAAFATGQMFGPVIAGYVVDATKTFTFPLLITSLTLAVTAIAMVRGTTNEKVLLV